MSTLLPVCPGPAPAVVGGCFRPRRLAPVSRQAGVSVRRRRARLAIHRSALTIAARGRPVGSCNPHVITSKPVGARQSIRSGPLRDPGREVVRPHSSTCCGDRYQSQRRCSRSLSRSLARRPTAPSQPQTAIKPDSRLPARRQRYAVMLVLPEGGERWKGCMRGEMGRSSRHGLLALAYLVTSLTRHAPPASSRLRLGGDPHGQKRQSVGRSVCS